MSMSTDTVTPQKTIPVTIITGFLGSGKTTLLNEIITQNPGTKFAIIENEFGEIGLDQEFVIQKDGNIFELSNGCICCSINDELVENLLKLAASPHNFDHLLIETTGIAEPLAVAEAFLSDPLIRKKFSVNAIVCMVDCEQIEEMLKEEEEAGRQVSAADMIIFNKCDLVTDTYIQQTRTLLKGINPYADSLLSSHGKVDTQQLLSLTAYDEQKVSQKQDAIAHEHEHDHHHHHHITSYSFTFDQDFDFQKFYQWATVLLTFQSGRIYRIKGVISFNGHEEKMVFQSVKNRFLLTPAEKWETSTKRNSRIVFIGKELRKDILEKHLKQCLKSIE